MAFERQKFTVSAILMLSLSAAVLLPASQQTAEPNVESGIRQTLDAQVKAWNTGDLQGFMDGYVRDESLRFASGGSVRRGWQEALNRYQAAYPTREKMGTLTFSELEFFKISTEYTEVFGKYHLARNKSEGDAAGIFTLLMKREGDRWLVLHDHTSAAD